MRVLYPLQANSFAIQLLPILLAPSIRRAVFPLQLSFQSLSRLYIYFFSFRYTFLRSYDKIIKFYKKVKTAKNIKNINYLCNTYFETPKTYHNAQIHNFYISGTASP